MVKAPPKTKSCPLCDGETKFDECIACHRLTSECRCEPKTKRVIRGFLDGKHAKGKPVKTISIYPLIDGLDLAMNHRHYDGTAKNLKDYLCNCASDLPQHTIGYHEALGKVSNR